MSHCRRLTFVGLALAATLTGSVAASQGAAACRDMTDRDGFGELTLAQVKTGRDKVHFAKPDCAPGKPGSCAMKAYVVPGDLVLIGQVFDASACALYVDAKGRVTEGLLPNERLESPRRAVAETATALVGTWTRTEAEITIKPAARDGTMEVEGGATYGALDKARVARGAVNFGEIGFKARPARNRIEDGWTGTDAYTCAVAMIALGPYLVVEDNRKCGGMNVSFTGVYRRR